jgi:hypothetical protein
MSSKYTPTTKITAAMIGGAFASILVWVLRQFADVDIPVEVGSSVAVLMTVAAGYMTPEG